MSNQSNGYTNGYQLNRNTSTGDLGNTNFVRATEGWLELFLTPHEKFTFSKWREDVRNRSLVHSYTVSFFEYLVRFVPEACAPNLITVAGFIGLGQTWYLTYNYGEDYPIQSSWLATAGVFSFYIINSLVNPHADRTRQHTPLSDLFKYACDNASTIWLAMLTTACLGGLDSLETQWYAVQAGQLALFLKHLSAYRRHAGLRYHFGAGPGEVLMTCVFLLAVRATVGLEFLQTTLVDQILRRILRWVDFTHTTTNDQEQVMLGETVRLVYYGFFVSAVLHALRLPSKPHAWTKFGLLMSLLMRLVPGVLLHAGVSAFPLTVSDIICDGLFMAVLTTDLTLAKMAGRELHPWVVVMSLSALLNRAVILTLVAVYFIGVFSDLCFYLNLPLLATCRNVYCDGVYDLCHIGHKRAFQRALGLGNRLFVGVVGDEDASKYKRPPIMTAAERCAEVEACKAVTKVIPNAPCFGITQEFLDEHQIHVVAFGEEYLERYPDPKDDPYYSYVRKIGIAHPLPRTTTLSTSDLIKRIQKAQLSKNSPT